MNNNSIDNVDSLLDDQIINENVNFPRSLRRSIWLVEDVEDGDTYTADYLLDNVPQDILFNIRTTLTAAYKSGKYKYICKECQQPLGLKIRTNEGDEFPFFSHYQNSEPCHLKNHIEIDPTHSVHNLMNAFQTSLLHQMMLEKLHTVLSYSSSFENTTINKLISTPEIKGYRKPSIYSHFKHEKEVCFDLLLSNPMLGLLVGRNAFYKMHKMFYLWIFPSFTTRYQRICQKDILYMNRRNVFVFDSKDFYTHENKRFCGDNTNTTDHIYAYEESIRQNRLMLNCYWQSPEVTEIDGEKHISIQWNGPELVAFEDLHFDTASYEVYYHDSDIDFYNTYPAEIQKLIDEWIKIKKDRWIKIFDGIERRKNLYAQLMQRRERNERLKYYYSLLKNGDMEPTPFYDKESKLYGYKIDEFDIIPPIYYEAKTFYCGYAWVRKKTKWGVIDFKNNRICNFQYSQVYELKDGLFYAYKNQKFVLIDYKGERLGTATFDKIELLSNGLFKICNIIVIGHNRGWYYNYSIKKELWGLINHKGDFILPCEFDKIDNFENGKVKVYKGSICGTIDEFGKEEYEITKRSDVIIYKSTLLNKYGLMDNNHLTLTKPLFSSIGDFSNGVAKVCNGYRYGIISELGNLVAPCEYDDIHIQHNGYSALKQNSKWAIANSKGVFISNQYYEQLGKFGNEAIFARQDGNWGIINYNGEIVIPFEYDEIIEFEDGVATIRKNNRTSKVDIHGHEIYNYYPQEKVVIYESQLLGKFGIMDASHKPITDLIFNRILEFKDGKAKTQKGGKWGVVDLKGEIIIPFKFDELGDFTNGKALVRIGYNKGYIDEEGNEIYKTTTLENGYLLYKSSLLQKYGIMSPMQEDITGFIYDNVHKIKQGEYKAKKENKWGVIDTLGNVLLPFEYDTIGNYENEFFKVYKDGKRGVLNASYQVVIPTKYDEIGEIKNGIVSVRKGKWWKKIALKEANKIDLSKLEECTIYNATTTGYAKMGVFIEIPNIGIGLIPAKEILAHNKTLKDFKRDTKVKVMVLNIDTEKKRASFKFAE